MPKIAYTPSFRRDVKSLEKKGYDTKKLDQAIIELANRNQEVLLAKYHDHALKGQWEGYRELHIKKNWLLIYRNDKNTLTLVLTRTGTHDELL